MLSITETQTNVTAPVFKSDLVSDCSSPFNRLANILTDKKPMSPTSSNQTQVFSDRDQWLSPDERSMHRLECRGR